VPASLSAGQPCDRRAGLVPWLGVVSGRQKVGCLVRNPRQAASEEKVRHAHYGTGSLDVVIAALVVWPNVVCDCTTAGFIFI
jgi:hypothetical protein